MNKKIEKFTFKRENGGMWDEPWSVIRLNNVECGYINKLGNRHRIRFQVVCSDAPNGWRWVQLKQVFDSDVEARDWVNENFESINKIINIFVG